jgi:hypothetical protein
MKMCCVVLKLLLANRRKEKQKMAKLMREFLHLFIVTERIFATYRCEHSKSYRYNSTAVWKYEQPSRFRKDKVLKVWQQRSTFLLARLRMRKSSVMANCAGNWELKSRDERGKKWAMKSRNKVLGTVKESLWNLGFWFLLNFFYKSVFWWIIIYLITKKI